MTLLERKSMSADGNQQNGSDEEERGGTTPVRKPPEQLTEMENQFRHMMEEFKANSGFSVNTNEHAVDTMLEILSSKDVAVSITVLMAYIRYCVNHGLKKDITLKIGHNKPPSVPLNFAINDEMIEDIYPGDVVEIN